MELIIAWWSVVSQLEGAFSRKKTFYWASHGYHGLLHTSGFHGRGQ